MFSAGLGYGVHYLGIRFNDTRTRTRAGARACTRWREARRWQEEDWLGKQQAVTSYLLYKTSRFTHTLICLSTTTMLTYHLLLSSFSRSRGPSDTNRSHGVRVTAPRGQGPTNIYCTCSASARIGPPWPYRIV